MKEYPEIKEHFCVELQELLDRYKILLSPPTIMRIAQKTFHDTLSIHTHPELYPEFSQSNLAALREFVEKGPQLAVKYMWVDELHDAREEKNE